MSGYNLNAPLAKRVDQAPRPCEAMLYALGAAFGSC